jgi:hypothetical protein
MVMIVYSSNTGASAMVMIAYGDKMADRKTASVCALSLFLLSAASTLSGHM